MFSASAELYDALYAFKDYAAEAARVAALAHALHPEARTVLDVGCGTGEHARLLAASHGFEADGIDLDPGLLAVARAKHPAGRFTIADMSRFSLGRRYDVVLCLFSSIGYLVTLDRLTRALRCFRDHLAPDGIVLVEPWFAPGTLEPERTGTQTATAGDTHVVRTSRTEIAGRVSRLHFAYVVERPSGREEFQEVHELGLWTPAEVGGAFAAAGLAATFDPEGISGRGLWTARAGTTPATTEAAR